MPESYLDAQRFCFVFFSVEECLDKPSLIIIKQHKDRAAHGNYTLKM